MIKEQLYPNDILMATLNAPEASTFDLINSNITASNTSFYSPEEYKELPFIKKTFTENGVFNEDKFNKVYDVAKEKYNNLEDANTYEGLKQYLEYDKYGMYRPFEGKLRDVSFKGEVVKDNPLFQSKGILGLNVKGEAKYTPQEAAQSGRIWDYENKKWLDETAEDRNILKKAFGQSLVYAQYDATRIQENPITGEKGMHFEGEMITDENGNYFTETLGNRQLLNKEVVTLGDTLTKEGSFWNKLDFWDSDGYDKSLGGIAMKTTVNILPYFTPIAGYYGAFVALFNLMSVMPTLYKSLESIVTGLEKTALSPAATSLENWFRKFDSSTSLAGRQGFFNIENIGNLVADTFGQLYQQRAAAKLAPKVLGLFDKDIATINKYNKFIAAGNFGAAKELKITSDALMQNGKRLNDLSTSFALGYMGLTLAASIYNDALNAGYDERTAGITALASAAALFGIMKFNAGRNGLGTWFLDKTTGYNETLERGAVVKVAKTELNKFLKDVRTAIQTKDKEKFAYTIREWKRNGASALHNAFVIGGEDFWKGFVIESTEEVTEEAVQDVIKGITDTMSWLGYTENQGSFGGWSNVFSKEGLERYIATYIGGGLGGAIFAGQRNYIDPWVNRTFKGAPTPEQKHENYTLAKIILDGRFDEYLEALDSSKKYVKNNLDANYIEVGDEKEYVGKTSDVSQADLIVEAAKRKAYVMKAALERELGPNFKDLSDFEKQMYAHGFAEILDQYGFAESYLHEEFTRAAGDILTAREQVDYFQGREDLTDEEKELFKLAKEDLKQKVQNFKEFFTAERWGDYIFDAGVLEDYVLNKGLFNGLFNMSKEDYAANVYHITDLETADEQLKTKITAEYAEYANSNLDKETISTTLPVLRNIFKKIALTTSKNIAQDAERQQNLNLLKYFSESYKDRAFFTELLEEIQRNVESGELSPEDARKAIDNLRNDAFLTQNLLSLISTTPKFFSIRKKINFDLWSQILPALDIQGYNDKQIKILQYLVNDQAVNSDINIWTPDLVLQLLFNVEHVILPNATNIYAKKINDLTEAQEEGITPVARSLGFDKSKLKFELIAAVKVNSLTDLAEAVSVDGKISKELKELLLEIYLDYFGSISNPYLEFNPIIKDIKAPLPERINAMQEFLTNTKIILPEGKYEYEGIIGKDEDWNQEKYELEPARILEEVQAFEKILQMQELESGIIKALKSIYIGIHGSITKSNIFDELHAQADIFRTAEGLANELTLVEYERISRDISNTLRIAENVIRNMAPGGVVHMFKQYGEITGDSNAQDYCEMSQEEVETALNIISDIREQFARILDISDAISLNKHAAEKRNRDTYNFGLQNWLSNQTFNIGPKTISIPQDDIPETGEDAEELIYRWFSEYHQLILKILTDSEFIETASNKSLTPELYLIQLILEQFNNKELKDLYVKANELVVGDNNLKKWETINKAHIAQLLTTYSFISPEILLSEVKEVIGLQGKNIYPKFDQELTIQSILTQAHSVKLGQDGKFNFQNYFVELLNERIKNITEKRLFTAENAILVFGGPGSGKSFVESIIKQKLVKILGSDFYVCATTQDKVLDLVGDSEEGITVSNLIDKLQSGLNDVSETIENIHKELAGTWLNIKDDEDKIKNFVKERKGITPVITKFKDKEYITSITVDYDQFNESGTKTGVTAEYELRQVRKNNTGEIMSIDSYLDISPIFIKHPDLSIIKLDRNLIIDECTLLSPAQIALLTNIAKNNNKLIIFAGDHIQLQYAVEAKGEKESILVNTSIAKICNLTVAPMLISSYRFTSDVMTKNLQALATAIEKISKLNSNLPISDKDIQNLVSDLAKIPLLWKKLQSGEFVGHKIEKSIELFTDNLLKYILSEIQAGKQLMVVTETEESKKEISEILTSNEIDISKVKFAVPETAQGGEKDYVICYKLSASKQGMDNDLMAFKAYTMLSRSKFGTLILDDENGLFSTLKIHSSETEAPQAFIYPEDKNEEANKNRISQIDNILASLGESIPEQEPLTPQTNSNIPSPNQLDGPGKREFKRQQQRDNEDVKIIKTLDDVSIWHTWYTRLGVEWNLESLETKEVHEILDPLSKEGILEDFLLWSENEGKDTVKRKHCSFREAADEFLIYKRKLVKSIKNKEKDYTFRVIKKVYNSNTDFCYAKTNDNESINDILLLQVLVNNGWITVGRLGYNKFVNEEGQEEVMSATQQNIFNTGQLIFKIKKDPSYDNVKKYFEARDLEEIDPKKFNPAFITYTNLRDYCVYDELENNQKLSKNGLIEYYFGKLTLDSLHYLGYSYEIINDPNNNPKTRDLLKAEILKYQKFEKIDPFENWGANSKPEKKVWIKITEKGTGDSYIGMIEHVLEGDLFEQILEGTRATKNGNVKSYDLNQFGRAVNYLVKNLDNPSEDIVKYLEENNGKLNFEILSNLLQTNQGLLQYIVDYLNEKVEETDLITGEELISDFLVLTDAFVDGEYKNYVSINSFRNNKLAKLISSKFNGWFFDNPTSSLNGTIIPTDEQNWILSRFYESEKMFIDWSLIEPAELIKIETKDESEITNEINQNTGIIYNSEQLKNFYNVLYNTTLESLSNLSQEEIDKFSLDINTNHLFFDIYTNWNKVNDVTQLRNFINEVSSISGINYAQTQDLIAKIEEKIAYLNAEQTITVEKVENALSKSIEASNKSDEEFFEALKSEIDEALKLLGNILSPKLKSPEERQLIHEKLFGKISNPTHYKSKGLGFGLNTNVTLDFGRKINTLLKILRDNKTYC